MWYTALDENTKGSITPSNIGSSLTGIRGETSGLGDFSIKLFNTSGSISHESYLSTVAPGLHLLRETVIQSLRLAQSRPNAPKHVVLAGELLPITGGVKVKKNFSIDLGSAKRKSFQAEPNFIATQITAKVPFSLDVVFESRSNTNREDTLIGQSYTEALQWHQSRFVQRFENTFHLSEKGCV